MFSSQSNLMCGREKDLYEDSNAWHNKFFREVSSKVDEEIFNPLFADDNTNNFNGLPNAQPYSRSHAHTEGGMRMQR
jgi:hypothetical protein